MKTTILSIVLRIVVLYIIMAIAFCVKAKSEQLIKIGIIDTGYNAEYANTIGAAPLKLCDTGHYDFLTNRPVVGHMPEPFDLGRGNHGTRVASIIAEKLGNINYCAVIIQLFNDKEDFKAESVQKRLVFALDRLKTQNVMVINMSYTGTSILPNEKHAMKELTSRGVSLFVAAGNDKIDLGKNCVIYPACYLFPNEYIIGALDGNKKCSVTNKGPMVEYFPGKIPNNLLVRSECATSYATPTALSEFVLSVWQLLHGAYRQVPTLLLKTQ